MDGKCEIMEKKKEGQIDRDGCVETGRKQSEEIPTSEKDTPIISILFDEPREPPCLCPSEYIPTSPSIIHTSFCIYIFFQCLPAPCPMPFVLSNYLSPHHYSFLFLQLTYSNVSKFLLFRILIYASFFPSNVLL